MLSYLSKIKITRWTFLIIVSLILIVLYLHQYYVEDFIEIVKLLISGLPGLILLIVLSLANRFVDANRTTKWIVGIASVAIPTLVTYYFWGENISSWIDRMEALVYNVLLIVIFLSTLWLAIKAKK
ncbi:MAG: hypothetical protein ABFS05_09305 [Bacteroidota bacterium]